MSFHLSASFCFSGSIYLCFCYSVLVFFFSSRVSLSLYSLCTSQPIHYLAGAHRAPIAVQHPDLPAVLDLVVMDTVTGAVVPVGAPAVIASLQVEAHCVVGTGVPPCLAFINICREYKKDDIIHMLRAGIFFFLVQDQKCCFNSRMIRQKEFFPVNVDALIQYVSELLCFYLIQDNTALASACENC